MQKMDHNLFFIIIALPLLLLLLLRSQVCFKYLNTHSTHLQHSVIKIVCLNKSVVISATMTIVIMKTHIRGINTSLIYESDSREM